MEIRTQVDDQLPSFLESDNIVNFDSLCEKILVKKYQFDLDVIVYKSGDNLYIQSKDVEHNSDYRDGILRLLAH